MKYRSIQLFDQLLVHPRTLEYVCELFYSAVPFSQLFRSGLVFTVPRQVTGVNGNIPTMSVSGGKTDDDNEV